jgi:hypothetical protein
MKGKIVVVEVVDVDVVVVSDDRNFSFEFVTGDGIVLRNDKATWHVISTELPNL